MECLVNTFDIQASNGRTAPRSSVVPPRPRAPRRARPKRLDPHDSAWTDEWHWHGAMDDSFGGLVVLESRLFSVCDQIRLWCVNNGGMDGLSTMVIFYSQKHKNPQSRW